MPVGSHKDAFKAHQTVKKTAGKDPGAVLANMAADILLDFVKSQRQVKADRIPERLPEDRTSYDLEKMSEALIAVEGLCGKCEEAHDDACFVNQTRRALIAAKTGVDLGTHFDGKKTLGDLIREAEEVARVRAAASVEEIPHQPLPASCEPFHEGSDEKLDSVLCELHELKEKDVFRRTLIDEIVETIGAVSEGNFAAEMPVHDDEQLGKLATAFNLMLETINQTMRRLDELVGERSRDLRMIMATVPTGLLSLNEDYKIKPEYSKACETFLGIEDLRGRDFFDSIGLTRRRNEDRAKLIEFLDVLRQRLLPEDDMDFLNPFPELEMKKNGAERSKWLRLRYHLFEIEKDKTPHILVLLEDITKAKAMQAEIEESQKENSQLKVIAEDPDLFCDFLRESVQLLEFAEKLTADIGKTEDPKPLIHEIFRSVHTIKGTAGAFAAEKAAGLAMTLENKLSSLRNEEKISAETINEMTATLAELTECIRELANKTRDLLGFDPVKGGAGLLRIDPREISRCIELVQEMDLDAQSKNVIIGNLKMLRAVPVTKGFGKALKIIPNLMERLGKEVHFIMNPDGVSIDCDLAQELNTPLIHLIRNAFDHGIESPEERVAAGKPEEGTITLSVHGNGDELAVELSDDGRGLDYVKLVRAAVDKKIITPEEASSCGMEEAYQLIFKPGFSTAEAVTDVSGRGVGMDAVWNKVCKDLDGKIAISSEPGKGTTFRIAVSQA
jgi:signal transduction histidine kinase